MFDWIMLVAGWVIVAFWLYNAGPLLLTRGRGLRRLTTPPAGRIAWPVVTVVVPARDEGAAIEACLASLLASDYPDLTIVAIDDRSSDDTGAVMDRLAASDPRLQVIHLRELPEGWLGKNHALHVGAQHARGDYILFTDGDILFEPDAIRRAVIYAEANRVEHLCLFPSLILGDYWENALVCFFALIFAAGTGFWLVRTRFKSIYIGVGAFNMVRREAYQRAGGHLPIRLDVADDLKLGRVMKQAGCRQDALFSEGLVRVKWHTTLWGVVRGLEKNAFAGMRYSVFWLLLGTGLFLLLGFGPYLALGFVRGQALVGFLVALAVMHFTFGLAGRDFGAGWRTTFALPVAMGAMLVAMWRSAIITLRQGGVRWRDTFYPLEVLRANLYR